VSEITLYQFRFSPFNEKVRWALDYKGVPHRRVSVLPGPHLIKIRALTGQTATPVLRLDGALLTGSARILAALEERYPEPALFPRDATERSRALEIERRFDEDWTPRMRRAVVATMLDEPAYFARTYAADRGPLARTLYRLAVPLAAGAFRRANGITSAASIEDGFDAAREALDFIAQETGPSGYLIGERFTVADLVAAAHLSHLCDLTHPDVERPLPHGRGVASWMLAWHDHVGTRWVKTMYQRHRPHHG
jgi:glutathione S-transferase